jgi:hypothetical protein
MVAEPAQDLIDRPKVEEAELLGALQHPLQAIMG